MIKREGRASKGLPWVFTTRQHVLALVITLVVPVLTAAGFLAYSFAKAETRRVEETAIAAVRIAAATIEREIAGMTVALQVLAASRALAVDDIPAFYNHVIEVARMQDAVIALRRPDHGQIINSAIPWGQPLPDQSRLVATDRLALTTRKAAVSDFYHGLVGGRASMAVVVPIFRDGEIRYFLSASFAVSRLRETLLRQPLPEGWDIKVTDSANTVIARTSSAEATGTQGLIPQVAPGSGLFRRHLPIGNTQSFAAQLRLGDRWSVIVSGPEAALTEAVQRAIGSTIAGAVVLIGLALVSALLIAGRISSPMSSLAAMGARIAKGEAVAVETFGNAEANSVARSLANASAVLRTREAELRNAEDRYSRLFRSIDEGFCVIDMIFDADGQPVDYRFVEVNPVFERQTGLVNAPGRLVTELVPQIERHWIETYGEVARTGTTKRFEHHSQAMGRWFDVYASRVAGDGSTLVALVFNDITARKRAEEALLTSERRYRSALRVGRIGAWETDFAKGERYWSEEGLALFGLDLPDRKGVVGGPGDEWRGSIHPADRKVWKLVQMLAHHQDQIQVEYRILRRDGTMLWLAGHAEVTARGPDGEPLCMINVAADITDRKRSEEALRQSETRFRAVQDTSIDGFMVLESVRDEGGVIRDFKWLYANEAAERIVGRPREQFIGCYLLDQMPGNRTTGLFDAYVRVVETGEPWTTELAYRQDGLNVYLRLVVARANDGFAVTFADLSERRRAEQLIAQSENRLQAALKAGQLGVHEWDLATGEIRCDATARDLWGIGPDDVLAAATFVDRLHPEDRSRIMDAVSRALDPEGGGHLEAEFRILPPGQASRWIVTHASVDFIDGFPARMVGTMRDVSARRKAEEQRMMLIHELNHRVKNTLAIVQSIAGQTFRRHNIDATVRRDFEHRLFALGAAHDVLTRESWQGADLAQIVSTALRSLMSEPSRHTIAGPPVRLTPHEAVTVAMAMHELGTNALKHGAWSVAGGTVDITWQCSAEDPAMLELVWKESGGPPVVAPAARGFGSRLLTQGLTLEFGAPAELLFEPDGLRCILRADLESLSAGPAASETGRHLVEPAHVPA